MQLIVRSLTTHVLNVSPDANVEVAMLVLIFYSSDFTSSLVQCWRKMLS